MALPNQMKSSTIDYLKLQDMLKNMSMNEVSQVAQGASGPVAQIFAMDEIGRRNQQQAEFAGEKAEEESGQPTMINQYLAMAQQMVPQQEMMPTARQDVPYPQSGIASMVPDAQQDTTQYSMFASGGSVRGFAPGGSTNEDISEEDLGILETAANWVKENPGEAALLGLEGLAIAATGGLAVGPALGRRGLIAAAKRLGSKGMSKIRSMFPKSRATRNIDKAIDMPDTYFPPRWQAERAAMIGREANRIRGIYGATALGGGIQALRSSIYGDNEPIKPREYFALTDSEMGYVPEEETAISTDETFSGEATDKADPTIADRFKSGEFNPLFQFMTRAGLELAAGKGNLGQDLGKAGIAGMDYVTAMQDRDREIARQRQSDALELEGMDIRQAELAMQQERQPYAIDLLKAQADSQKSRGYNRANAQIIKLIDDYLFNSGIGLDLQVQERLRLMSVYEKYGLEGLMAEIGASSDSLNDLLEAIR